MLPSSTNKHFERPGEVLHLNLHSAVRLDDEYTIRLHKVYLNILYYFDFITFVQTKTESEQILSF